MPRENRVYRRYREFDTADLGSGMSWIRYNCARRKPLVGLLLLLVGCGAAVADTSQPGRGRTVDAAAAHKNVQLAQDDNGDGSDYGNDAVIPEPVEAEPIAHDAGKQAESAEPTSADAQESPAAENAGKPLNRRIRTAPIRNTTVRAPRLGRRISQQPSSVFDDADPSSQAILPTEFGSEEFGFEMPDWSEPFRDIEANEMVQDLNSDRLDLNGKVRLRLGEMLFQSEQFYYSESQGLVGASGDVVVTQANSRLEAQALHYSFPDVSAVEKPTILEPPLTDEELQRRRLMLGNVKAEGLHILEPTRELSADSLTYDMRAETGELINARGHAGIYYFFAEKLTVLGPNSFRAENVWLTTCECDFETPPPYRILLKDVVIHDGQFVSGKNLRFQIKGVSTPLFLPIWRSQADDDTPWVIDFDTGSRAELGSFINTGQQYRVNPDFSLGPRLFVTQKEGVGFGIDSQYDYMETPSSRIFRTKGSLNALHTTENRGYVHWYNRYEPDPNLTVKTQVEHWSDTDFYKDFYYERYRNRTTPRSFTNVTYRTDDYIAEGTLRLSTHGWVRETERLPEGSITLVERPLGGGFFLSADASAGYYNREPRDLDAGRGTAQARLTFDWDPGPALSITPFAEVAAAYYTDTIESNDSAAWAAATLGVTAQTRLQRTYGGALGFSAFKHIIVPSLTLSHRPSTGVDIEDVPFFDSRDARSGRTRIEAKLDNIFLGRDAETGEVWQVGRLTLYQGNDFWNETRLSDDYELELDLRPRPWWGMQLVGEHHVTDRELDLERPFLAEQVFLQAYERISGRPFDRLEEFDFNTRYGDYSRVLAQLYYDDTYRGGRVNGRVGFSYTKTFDTVYNREILYGIGYRLSDKWSAAFEHRYDLEGNNLRSQTYELRRLWNCWETAIIVEDRERGVDINVEFSISELPNASVKL